jgi:hypothetical protein
METSSTSSTTCCESSIYSITTEGSGRFLGTLRLFENDLCGYNYDIKITFGELNSQGIVFTSTEGLEGAEWLSENAVKLDGSRLSSLLSGEPCEETCTAILSKLKRMVLNTRFKNSKQIKEREEIEKELA